MNDNGGEVFQTMAKARNNVNKWYFDEYKVIKILESSNRIAFQRKGRYVRGVTISEDAFRNLSDVSIVPTSRQEIEKNTYIFNLGSRIQIIKYCFSRDGKRCEGGFFNFTPKEWQYFWISMRPKVINYLNE